MPTEAWTFRELLWAADAKHRLLWQSAAYALAWIVNSQPSFSKHRRPVHPDKINPYIGKAPRGVPMNSREGEAMMEAIARRNRRRKDKERQQHG